MRQVRPWLFLALVILGNLALAVALTLRGRRLVQWLVQHGVTGVWGKAALLAIVAVTFTLILEASRRLAYLGAPTPRSPGAAKATVFIHSLFLLILAWLVAAHYLARLLTPHVPSGLAGWLELLLVLFGVLAILFAGGRAETRLGITLGRRNQS